MKEIKKLGEVDYKLPQMCTEEGHVADLIDKMFDKIDELVEEVNKLKKKI